MEQESDGNALREFSTPKLNPETRDFEEELERIKQETTKGWANFGSKFSNDEERMGVIQDFTSILGINQYNHIAVALVKAGKCRVEQRKPDKFGTIKIYF